MRRSYCRGILDENGGLVFVKRHNVWQRETSSMVQIADRQCNAFRKSMLFMVSNK
jgi:hypothetical protein